MSSKEERENILKTGEQFILDQLIGQVSYGSYLPVEMYAGLGVYDEPLFTSDLFEPVVLKSNDVLTLTWEINIPDPDLPIPRKSMWKILGEIFK